MLIIFNMFYKKDMFILVRIVINIYWNIQNIYVFVFNWCSNILVWSRFPFAFSFWPSHLGLYHNPRVGIYSRYDVDLVLCSLLTVGRNGPDYTRASKDRRIVANIGQTAQCGITHNIGDVTRLGGSVRSIRASTLAALLQVSETYVDVSGRRVKY